MCVAALEAARIQVGDSGVDRLDLHIAHRLTCLPARAKQIDGVGEYHPVSRLGAAASRFKPPHRCLNPAGAVDPMKLLEVGVMNWAKVQIALLIRGRQRRDASAPWVIGAGQRKGERRGRGQGRRDYYQ